MAHCKDIGRSNTFYSLLTTQYLSDIDYYRWRLFLPRAVGGSTGSVLQLWTDKGSWECTCRSLVRSTSHNPCLSPAPESRRNLLGLSPTAVGTMPSSVEQCQNWRELEGGCCYQWQQEATAQHSHLWPEEFPYPQGPPLRQSQCLNVLRGISGWLSGAKSELIKNFGQRTEMEKAGILCMWWRLSHLGLT